ncbi:hypothetical protein [Streptomyces yaizuensis]|uniref:Integral membrane protein n=1 Tax=Streptomyces yaizuensis TaxID=2989713 RepID=A0ABQ5P953_9ACTN|nr:hypothetical protein [Streptomyces sp. YSPA8]GLF99105.1 hypothetical protein SYYSPA8_32430 [Streptomyces sp. YSPA8]
MTDIDIVDRRLVKRIAIGIALVALLPFLLPVVIEQRNIVNGKLTEYTYLNFTAIVAGLASFGYAYRTFTDLRFQGRHQRVFTVLLAVLVVLGLFQLVRGSGVVPAVTECSASFSLDFCRPA